MRPAQVQPPRGIGGTPTLNHDPHRLRRAVALAIGLGLGGPAVVALGHAPSPTPPRAITAVAGAARWVSTQLADGDHIEGLFGPDYGLTADVVLALGASGHSGTAARATAGWLEDHAREYLDGGFPGDVSAGAVAKLALVARAAAPTRRHSAESTWWPRWLSVSARTAGSPTP